MNIPTLIILLLVAAGVALAVRTWRRAGRTGGCGCSASGSNSSACSGCSAASGCPFCQGNNLHKTEGIE